jgi:hypothetical protein
MAWKSPGQLTARRELNCAGLRFLNILLRELRFSMTIVQAGLGIPAVDPFTWGADWACGLPLIVLTVLIHVIGLGLVSQRDLPRFSGMKRRHPKAAFVVVTGGTTLLATCLHGLEAGLWAIAYRLLGAVPTFKSSMLYSLNAMTSYGHESLMLDNRWQLMGALEAVNGWLLFGLTTAFLFAVIQNVWFLDNRQGPL